MRKSDPRQRSFPFVSEDEFNLAVVNGINRAISNTSVATVMEAMGRDRNKLTTMRSGGALKAKYLLDGLKADRTLLDDALALYGLELVEADPDGDFANLAVELSAALTAVLAAGNLNKHDARLEIEAPLRKALTAIKGVLAKNRETRRGTR